MNITARSGPDAQPEALHDLFGIISPVRSRLRKVKRFQLFPNPDLINKTFHQTHPSKWGDWLGGIFYRKVNHFGATLHTSKTAYSTKFNHFGTQIEILMHNQGLKNQNIAK
jgi:hypothetical protein